jgi:hypothetical protein
LLDVTRLSDLNKKLTLTDQSAAAILGRSPHLDWSQLVELEIRGTRTNPELFRLGLFEIDLCLVLLAIEASSPNLKILKLTSLRCRDGPASEQIFEALANKTVLSNLSELHLENIKTDRSEAKAILKIMQLR